MITGAPTPPGAVPQWFGNDPSRGSRGCTVGKVLTTLLTVVIAVGVSAGIWIVANLVFNQARNRWRAFNAMCFAAIGFLIGAVLAGNHLTLGSPSAEDGGFLAFIWLPVASAVVFAALGAFLERVDDPRQRLVVSTVSGVGHRRRHRSAHPRAVPTRPRRHGVDRLDRRRARPRRRARASCATVRWNGACSPARPLGFVLGGWGCATLGGGSVLSSIIASAVPLGTARRALRAHHATPMPSPGPASTCARGP